MPVLEASTGDQDRAEAAKIAVFLPNWLGDAVMATPTLRALRRHFGGARLVGILRPHLAALLDGTTWLDEQWYLDPRLKGAGLGRLSLVRRMRRERFDVAILMTNSLSSALIAWLGGARERIGYMRDGRALLLTRRLRQPLAPGRWVNIPTVDYYLALAAAVGCAPESPRLEVHTTPADEQSAADVFRRLGLRTDGRVVALNGGSGSWVSRWWPTAHFGQLAQWIVDRLDHDVLVLCGPQEVDMARAIAQRAQRPRVHSMADQPLDIGTTKACLRRCALAVSTDSGLRHLAAALDKPVITLRGPTQAIWSYNPTVKAVDLQLDLDCIGCRKGVCPLRRQRCMEEITPEWVYEAVADLARGRAAEAA